MTAVALYQIVNRQTGKTYVGITKNPQKRWTAHKSDARRGSEHHFHRAIRAHGEENFEFVVQAWFPTPELAKLAEQTSICFARPEYNSTTGGDGTFGWSPSPETRQKMREAKLGKPSPLKGVPKSQEARANMSAARKGKPGHKPSDETRAKLSAAQMGNTKNLGKTRSPETCAKISAAMRGNTNRKRAA